MEIIQAVFENKTMLASANALGMPFMTFRHRAKKLNVYKPNQSRKGIPRLSTEYFKQTISLYEILNGQHPHYNTNSLKKRLIKEGIKQNKCENENCSIVDVWNGKPLVLHLDHIDGDSTNHKLENLRMLCPNCHSQTETYAGKKTRKK